MTNMTPSEKVVEMTDGQIDKAVDILRAILRKHRDEFNSEAVQITLGVKELGPEWLDIFRKRVEAFSSMIVRRVSVNRNLTSQQVLDATKRKQYINSDVVASIPKGEGDEVDVYFFKLDRFVSDDDLEKEYALRGLKSADPYSQSAVNEADPVFADKHPNGTHWKDINSKWCFATFGQWFDERNVGVNRLDLDWDDVWCFAGLRK